MGWKIVLALLFVAAMPTVARAQVWPPTLLSQGRADRLPVLDLETRISADSFAIVSGRAIPSTGTPVAQKAKRPLLLQHIGLGALGGFVIGAATGIMGDDEFRPGIAGAGAVLGALVGVVIWNIRVMP